MTWFQTNHRRTRIDITDSLLSRMFSRAAQLSALQNVFYLRDVLAVKRWNFGATFPYFSHNVSKCFVSSTSKLSFFLPKIIERLFYCNTFSAVYAKCNDVSFLLLPAWKQGSILFRSMKTDVFQRTKDVLKYSRPSLPAAELLIFISRLFWLRFLDVSGVLQKPFINRYKLIFYSSSAYWSDLKMWTYFGQKYMLLTQYNSRRLEIQAAKYVRFSGFQLWSNTLLV